MNKFPFLGWSIFKKTTKNKLKNNSSRIFIPVKNEDKDNSVIIDQKRRNFLKSIGGVGIGAAILSLLPTNHADALVMGGTPATSVVGMKNVANARVNPATEDTLSGIKTGTDNLANIKTAIDSIKTNSDLFHFDGESLKITGVSGGGSAETVGLKDASNIIVNPSTDDSLVYLRRMVKLLESNSVVDVANRQRISIDGVGAGVTLPVSVTINNLTTMAGQNQQMYQDVARNAYANGIRENLIWS